MIGGLLTGIATSPWMRAALRDGAIALAVLLFLLSLRRSGERAGRLRLVRRTAMQTAVRMITTGVMLALLAGIAIKLKIFGGGP